MNDLTKFAEEIKHQRISLSITQLHLAEACGLSPSYISKIENNQTPHPPARDVILSLATALELDDYELTLMAGYIPDEMQKLFYRVLLAYPKDKVLEILENAFCEAIC